MKRIENVPPQLRAGIAATLAVAGIQASGEPTIDIAIALVWAIGGLVDWWMTRRGVNPDSSDSLDARQARLREAAESARRLP